MRQAAWRVVRLAAIVIVLLMFFAAGGTALLVAGEAPALPLAVGGFAAQLSVIALGLGTLRVRMTLVGDTVDRTALVANRRLFATVRVVLLVIIALLVGYAVVRLAMGDPWALLITGLVGIVLWLLASGMARLRNGLDASLSVEAGSTR